MQSMSYGGLHGGPGEHTGRIDLTTTSLTISKGKVGTFHVKPLRGRNVGQRANFFRMSTEGLCQWGLRSGY